MKARYHSFSDIDQRLKILKLKRQIEVEKMKLNLTLGQQNLGLSMLKSELPMILFAKLYRKIKHIFN
ncbi:DUF6327 family protein [Flagellimonas sp.]|uniref:DUF6327 family protein n=1 Tax=Flagellimonas sp. TaxID=2058762 RepID=UPI003BAD2E0F